MAYRYYIIENDFPVRVEISEAGAFVAEALRPDGVWVALHDFQNIESACRVVDEQVALTWWQQHRGVDRTTRRGNPARCGNCGVRRDTYLTVHSPAAPIPEGRCGFCTPQGLARVVCMRRAAPAAS